MFQFQREQAEQLRQQKLQQQQAQARTDAILAALVRASGIPLDLPQTPALQPGGLQSQSQLPSQPQYTTPPQQVTQGFVAQPVGLSPAFTPLHTGFTPTTESRSQLELGTPEYRLSATYSELTGQPTPTASRALDTTLAPPVSAPTAIVLSSVASLEPVVPAAPPLEPMIATVTEAVASTLTV